MENSIQLGRVMGIPVRLHVTFLLIIPWVAYLFGSVSATVFGKLYGFGAVEPPLVRWIYSLLFAILLFVCVGLHELGHSYVAKRYGIEIRSITLYFFGGVASMEEIPRNPSMELRMAIAGPAVSAALGVMSILLYTQSESILGEGHPFSILLWTLGIMNIILMIFNLIPAFPMDGGRVLRAWFSTRMPYVVATKNAAALGKIFAVFLIFLGLFTLNFLTLIIGIFLYIAASEEDRSTTIEDSLRGINVRHIMSKDVRVVPPEMTLAELMRLMFYEKHRGYPVMVNDELVGIVTITDLQRVPEHLRETTTVGDVMTRNIHIIGPDDEATTAIKIMSDKKIRRLPVIEDGRLVGIISREDLLRAIELCSDVRL